MKISEILLKYKSDKNLGLGPTGEGHCYGPAYDQVFEYFDSNAELNILEIGVQKGGSLVAWKEYFPNASIYGIDIEDQILDEYRRDDFNYLIADIKSDEAKEWLKNKTFDIIIDDGSHKPYDIMSSNITIDNNVLMSVIENKIDRYFYASSAHIYPKSLQLISDSPLIHEEQAYPSGEHRRNCSPGWPQGVAVGLWI
jgi:hypothetical protein